jgi:hypothetical protein
MAPTSVAAPLVPGSYVYSLCRGDRNDVSRGCPQHDDPQPHEGADFDFGISLILDGLERLLV